MNNPFEIDEEASLYEPYRGGNNSYVAIGLILSLLYLLVSYLID
jgi:hypothetical protein